MPIRVELYYPGINRQSFIKTFQSSFRISAPSFFNRRWKASHAFSQILENALKYLLLVDFIPRSAVII